LSGIHTVQSASKCPEMHRIAGSIAGTVAG
jgi:hypothetical protein